MPNTLAHIAVQATLARGLGAGISNFPAVLVGCVIPDVAWVIQRIVTASGMTVDPYELRAYATAQASLFVSLILGAAFAALFQRRLAAFTIISAGCLLHLLLDAAQIKWANGVTLLAPIDWRLLSWDLAWPEHPAVILATIAGVLVFVPAFRHIRAGASGLRVVPGGIAAFAALLATYLVLPLSMRSGPFDQDNHYIAALRDVDERVGRKIELDRVPVELRNDSWVARTFAKEEIYLRNFAPAYGGTYSIRGHFTSEVEIEVTEWHQHGRVRDTASVAGLVMVGAWLVAAVVVRPRTGESYRAE